jgi:predicted small secreted protein
MRERLKSFRRLKMKWRHGGQVMRSGLLLLLVATPLLLTACGTAGPAQGVDVCGPWRPIYLTPNDILSRGAAYDILAHNEIGAQLCGWRPVAN